MYCDIELEKRLAKRNKPLRTKTYDKIKHKRDQANRRYKAKQKMKQAQE